MIVAFGRVTIAALILLPFAGRERLGALRAHWRDYAVVGFFMAAAPFALFAYAERSLTAGLGSIINATTPLWTAIILAAWVHQAPTPRRIAAIVLGFAGVGVIVGLEGLQLAPDASVGVVAATAGAASYGIALTYIRQRMGPQPPIQLALGQLIAASIMLAPLAALSVGDVVPSTESVVAMVGNRPLLDRDRLADPLRPQPRRGADGDEHGHVPQPGLRVAVGSPLPGRGDLADVPPGCACWSSRPWP